MADQIYSMGQVGDILRKLRQYNATRGLAMPQGTQTALFEGAGKAAADEASQRYWRNLATQNQAEANRQRDEMLKMQKDAQGAQSLQGWIGLGYKGLGGEEGIKDLYGKAKDLFNPAYDVPAAYDPASASMSTLAQNNANTLTGSLGVQPETSQGLMGDYLDMNQGTIGDYFGGLGDEYLAGGGLPTIGTTGGGLAKVGAEGLVSDGGEADIIAAGTKTPNDFFGTEATPTGGFEVPWGTGAFAAGSSVAGDLLSGGNVNVGKAAGAGLGTLGGAALASSLIPGVGWAGTIGSILGGGGGGLLGDALGGTDSVLCTELHSQGELESEVYLLDSAYGLTVDAATLAGYHAWGKPVARAMSKSRVLTWLLKPFIRSWAFHMAHKLRPEVYKSRLLGRVLEAVGVPLCAALGRWVSRPTPIQWLTAALGGVPYFVFQFKEIDRLPRSLQRQFVDLLMEISKHIEPGPRLYRVQEFGGAQFRASEGDCAGADLN